MGEKTRQPNGRLIYKIELYLSKQKEKKENGTTTHKRRDKRK